MTLFHLVELHVGLFDQRFFCFSYPLLPGLGRGVADDEQLDVAIRIPLRLIWTCYIVLTNIV